MMKSIRYVLLQLSVIVPTVILSSCEKLQTFEVTDGVELQLSLYEAVVSRKQVTDVCLKEDGVGIYFGNKQLFEAKRTKIPVLTVSDDGWTWLVNGVPTLTAVNRDTEGKIVTPSVSLSGNGTWLVGSIDSGTSGDTEYYRSISSDGRCIYALAVADSYLFCFTVGGEVLRAPIVSDTFYQFPDYFYNQLVTKELKAEELLDDCEDNQVSFIFLTDVHWGKNQKHSPALIKHIVDYTPLERVFFGGDVITYHTDDPQEALELGFDFQKSFSFLGPDFYCVFGNHDDNALGQSSEKEKHLTEEQIYSYLQSQMTGVAYGPYYNFYFDDEKSKTRFLCLDTGRFYLFRKAYTSMTAEYAIGILNTVPEGWHVIAVSHIWTNLVSQDTGESKESEYVRPLIEILENYNKRAGATFKYNGKSIEYDFSNAGGKVEYCLGGHTHADAVVMSDGGIPLVTLSCDGQQQVAGGLAPTGTTDEQCVGIFVTDYERRKLSIVHVGRGDDITIAF